MTKITWYGHSAFKIESVGTSILIDPFFAPKYGFVWEDAGKVDYVLVTHDHGDHVGSTVDICKRWDAKLGTIVGTAEALVKRGVPQELVLNGIGFNIGGTLMCGKVAVTMTQAFHTSDSGSPAGYILRPDGGPVLYHAGDTGIFGSMNLLSNLYDIKLALLPIGGVFTMDGYQAAHACALIGCQSVIPMHWGTFPMLAQSPDEFYSLLKKIAPQCQGKVMKPGESLEV